MRVLSEKEIQSVYSMKDAIFDLKQALTGHYYGKVKNPSRTVINFAGGRDSVLYMPSALKSANIAAIKVVSIFPNNPKLGKKTTQGVILITDTETGEHLACMNASYLTRLRTGAVSAIATDHLAKESANTAAVIGCGAMAEEQVKGILAVRNIRHVILYNRTKSKAEKFAEKIKEQNPEFTGNIDLAETADKAVEQADIIICSTRSETPVFSGDRLNPGTHINGIGSYLPHMQEVDETTILHSSKIVADTIEGVKEEAGDFIIPVKKGIWSFERLHGQLDELAAGAIPGRENDTEITFFKSVGTAYFDLAVAASVYEKAVQSGLGTEVKLS